VTAAAIEAFLERKKQQHNGALLDAVAGKVAASN
jgi:hypothetical protein